MTEQRGRPRRRYGIQRVRLINFHNLVDETIEVREGGHLFLLGDNGSGKTTILDAVHYALSGGNGVELNAAARVGGRRNEGRSLAGIVLRQDPERGLINEGGAVAYVIVELNDSRDGHRVCFGLGMEATTMEARVTHWGVLHAGPLEDLTFFERDEEGRPCPVGREVFRRQLPKHETFGQMSDYRKAVADRLFGGMGGYEEVCRFWGMAKAYREIVSRTRDFDALFAQLLAGPDTEMFAEILGSLRAIDELELSLGELERQREYVQGLLELRDRIAKHREEQARYRWLLAFQRVEHARRERDRLAEEVERLEARREAADAAAQEAYGRVAAAAEAVRQATTTEAHSLSERLRSAEADVEQSTGELARARAELDEARRREHDARELHGASAEGLSRKLEAAATGLERAVSAARSAPGTLPALHAAVADELAFARGLQNDEVPQALPELHPAARTEARELASSARGEVAHRERAVASCRDGTEACRREVDALAAVRELGPAVEGLDEARQALADGDIAATPVYELLEPRPGADAYRLAAAEELIGDDGLAAIVVDPEHLDRARALLVQRVPGIRVVCRTSELASLPRWVDELLQPASDFPAGLAWAALAAALAQPEDLGPPGAPDATGAVELRGLAFRPRREEPRVLGAEARKREHARRLQAAREALERAEQAERRAEDALEVARRVEERARNVSDALEALRGGDIRDAHFELLRAEQAEVHASEIREGAQQRAERAEQIHAEHRSLLDALRARADELGTEEIERRIAELRDREAQARKEHEEAVSERAAAEESLRTRREQLRNSRDDIERLEEELRVQAAELREHLEAPMDDAALERHVLVTLRGNQFGSIGAIEARLYEAVRQEDAARVELEGDGRRGICNLSWAGRFGFSYDREANHLEDRRAQPAANVLAQLDRDITEQREVVNERTRALMDTLVMGELARHLQTQVERLFRMIKEINRLLENLRFGRTRYTFKVTPRRDRRELVQLVRELSVLNDDSRKRFRNWIDERLEELRLAPDDEVPELLDYRKWFDYRLAMRTVGEDDVELTRELRVLGSGGEQAVPNYLLVLALASLLFDSADARLRPLLCDEAFYGIDTGRRDELLRFATELGLQLFVASPDQDGATEAVDNATTLFVVKDEHGDVHLAPYHYWNRSRVAQPGLFEEAAEEPPAADAECVLGLDEE